MVSLGVLRKEVFATQDYGRQFRRVVLPGVYQGGRGERDTEGVQDQGDAEEILPQESRCVSRLRLRWLREHRLMALHRLVHSKYASASSSKTGPNPWHAIAESRPLVSTRFREMAASDLTLSWLASDPTAFSEPIFIASPEGLDMRVLPADIKISEIASLVGPETPIDVIDVASQSGLHSWTLGRWAEYYEKPGPREKIRNVISLELSSSPIKDRIASPVS